MNKQQEKLSRSLSTAQERLNRINSDLAFHIKEDHKGRLPTTCHRCGNLQQRRLFVLEVVELEGKIRK